MPFARLSVDLILAHLVEQINVECGPHWSEVQGPHVMRCRAILIRILITEMCLLLVFEAFFEATVGFRAGFSAQAPNFQRHQRVQWKGLRVMLLTMGWIASTALHIPVAQANSPALS